MLPVKKYFFISVDDESKEQPLAMHNLKQNKNPTKAIVIKFN